MGVEKFSAAAAAIVLAALFIAAPSRAGQEQADTSPAATQLAQAAQVAAVNAADAPGETVGRLHGSLLQLMQNAKQLGFDGRRKFLDQVIPNLFNLRGMAQVAAGPYWGQLSDADRERVIDVFSRMTVATYASRFDGYSGETFQVLEEKKGPKDTVFVRTQIVRSDGEAVKLDYLTRPYDGTWLIIDIFVKGSLSELATRRSEYTSVIKNDGVDGLVRTLEQKIRELQVGA